MTDLINKIRNEFLYEPDTGFVIKKSLNRRVGWVERNGYRCVKVANKDIKEHRFIFAFVEGKWPFEDVDHINGNKSDNRWSNLRAVSTSVNMQNQTRAHKCNASGLLGVTKSSYSSKWRARIRINKKEIYLGLFDDEHEAHKVYLEAKKRLHEGSTI